MSRYILLLLLADATYYMVSCSSRRCKRTSVPPKVTVADSDHLRVNWEKSFDGCDNSKVHSATVRIGSSRKTVVLFGTNERVIRADPCRKHTSIRIELDYDISHKIITSHQKSYNAESGTTIRPEDLYSGLLQEQVIDKICKREKGQLLNVDPCHPRTDTKMCQQPHL